MVCSSAVVSSGSRTSPPLAVYRLPQLERLGVCSGWSGYYEVSPDHNALVGAAAQPKGLFYATGFSGHGFQQSPVVGEYLIDLALGQSNWIDLSALSAERFKAGTLRTEANVV